MQRASWIGLVSIVWLGLAGCGEDRAEAERKARAAQAIGAEEARRHLAAGEAQAREAAEAIMAGKRQAEALAKAALADSGRARALGLQAKAELDKVYQSRSDYDLDITTAGATTAHAEKLAAMPHVQVGAITVGYEEATERSLGGQASRRHFRATWRRGERDVIVGYQTEEKIDAVAFAKLLRKLVPVVERVLG